MIRQIWRKLDSSILCISATLGWASPTSAARSKGEGPARDSFRMALRCASQSSTCRDRIFFKSWRGRSRASHSAGVKGERGPFFVAPVAPAPSCLAGSGAGSRRWQSARVAGACVRFWSLLLHFKSELRSDLRAFLRRSRKQA